MVDDEEVVRLAARRALERRGYSVLTAENGAAAVELVARHPNEVSLVLLDLSMPVMSGVETARRIRQIRPRVPILLSSGFHEQEAMRKFRGVGFDGFIQKPYTSRQLAERVRATFAAGTS